MLASFMVVQLSYPAMLRCVLASFQLSRKKNIRTFSASTIVFCEGPWTFGKVPPLHFSSLDVCLRSTSTIDQLFFNTSCSSHCSACKRTSNEVAQVSRKRNRHATGCAKLSKQPFLSWCHVMQLVSGGRICFFIYLRIQLELTFSQGTKWRHNTRNHTLSCCLCSMNTLRRTWTYCNMQSVCLSIIASLPHMHRKKIEENLFIGMVGWNDRIYLTASEVYVVVGWKWYTVTKTHHAAATKTQRFEMLLQFSNFQIRKRFIVENVPKNG